MVSRRLSWSVPVMCVVKRGMNPSSTVMPTLSTLTRNAFATNDITSTASTFTVSSMKMMRANSEKCAMQRAEVGGQQGASCSPPARSRPATALARRRRGSAAAARPPAPGASASGAGRTAAASSRPRARRCRRRPRPWRQFQRGAGRLWRRSASPAPRSSPPQCGRGLADGAERLVHCLAVDHLERTLGVLLQQRMLQGRFLEQLLVGDRREQRLQFLLGDVAVEAVAEHRLQLVQAFRSRAALPGRRTATGRSRRSCRTACRAARSCTRCPWRCGRPSRRRIR